MRERKGAGAEQNQSEAGTARGQGEEEGARAEGLLLQDSRSSSIPESAAPDPEQTQERVADACLCKLPPETERYQGHRHFFPCLSHYKPLAISISLQLCQVSDQLYL